MMEQNIDLGDFCRLLVEEVSSLREELGGQHSKMFDQIISNAEAVLKKIDECIALCGFSGGKYQYSSGISLFFPWSVSSYAVSQKVYDKLFFVTKTKAGRYWNAFIAKFVTDVTFRKARSAGDRSDGGFTYFSYIYDEDKERQNSLVSSLLSDAVGDVIHFDLDSLLSADEREIVAQTDDETLDPSLATQRIPENGTHRIPENGTHRIPENGTHRIPENGTHKIPENGTHRIFGGMGLFLEDFMNYKNIETPWNLSGFSRQDRRLNGRLRQELKGSNMHVPPGE
jgi:hypothetical protein